MKKQLPGTEIIENIHKNEKKRAMARFMAFPLVVFTKKLVGTLFSLSILGLGIAAANYGQDMTNDVYRIAVLVSAACAVVDGAYLLYKALMDKE